MPESNSLATDEVQAVWALMGDYGRYVDDQDGESWSSLFGTDGALVVGSRVVTGPATLKKFAEGAAKGVHICAVPTVERTADGAFRAISAFMFVDATSGNIVAGRYIDHIASSGGRMVFVERQIEMRARVKHS